MYFVRLFPPLKFHISYPKAAFQEIFKCCIRYAPLIGNNGNEKYYIYLQYVINPIDTLGSDTYSTRL